MYKAIKGVKMRFKEFLDEGTQVSIKFTPSDTRDVTRALDRAGIDYTSMGDGELMANFRSRNEAKKKIEKLPVVVSYTMY